MARDPVCGMEVEGAPYYSRFKGVFWEFCCPTCKSKFDKEPLKYIAAIARPEEKGELPPRETCVPRRRIIT